MAAGRVAVSITPDLEPYFPAQEVRVKIEVFDIDDEPTDPGALVLTVRKPDETEYTIDILSMVNPAVGVYYYDVLLDLSYSWKWRVESGGPDAAEEGDIVVAGSVFTTELEPPIGPGTGHEGEIARVTGGVYVPYAGDADERPLVWRTGIGWISQALNLAAAAAVSGLLALTHLPPGDDGEVLGTVGGVVTWVTGGGGSGVPGGSPRQVQFNDGGSFNGISSITVAADESALVWSGTTVASGWMRFPHGFYPFIVARNNAGSADVPILSFGYDSTNRLVLGGSGVADAFSLVGSGGTHNLMIGGVLEYVASSTALTMQNNNLIMGSGFETFGATPAALGDIRATYGDTVVAARNNASGGDIQALAVGTHFSVVDTVRLGGPNTNRVAFYIQSGLSHSDVAFTVDGAPATTWSTASGFQMGGLPVQDASFFAHSGTVSSGGLLRGRHGDTTGLVSARNSANTGNVPILRWGVGTNNYIIVGGGVEGVAGLQLEVTTGSIELKFATIPEYTFDSSSFNLAGNNAIGAGYYSTSGTVAGTGLFRAPNSSDVVVARNATNSADLTLLRIDNVNKVFLGNGDVSAAVISVAASGNIQIRVAGGTEYVLNETAIEMNGNAVTGAGYFSASGTVAASGVLRGAHTTTLVAARNTANSADVAILHYDGSSGNVLVGDLINGGTVNLRALAGAGAGVKFNMGSISSPEYQWYPKKLVMRSDGDGADRTIFSWNDVATNTLQLGTAEGGTEMVLANCPTAFFGGTPTAKGTVTGTRGGIAALTSVLTLLASYGLFTDSSS